MSILGSLFGQQEAFTETYSEENRLTGIGSQQAMNAQAMSQQMAMRQQQIQADIYRSSFGDLYSEEEDLRKNNPAVKDAWEQYQMTLRLAKK